MFTNSAALPSEVFTVPFIAPVPVCAVALLNTIMASIKLKAILNTILRFEETFLIGGLPKARIGVSVKCIFY
jgi:hypothetical protein